MDKKTASILSLCQKAGKLVSGETACETALQAQQAKLVITCVDASDNTKKKFVNKAFFYGVKCFVCFTKDELNKAIGKQNRATAVVSDINFANRLEELIKSESENIGLPIEEKGRTE